MTIYFTAAVNDHRTLLIHEDGQRCYVEYRYSDGRHGQQLTVSYDEAAAWKAKAYAGQL